jgi:hypothetical protein
LAASVRGVSAFPIRKNFVVDFNLLDQALNFLHATLLPSRNLAPTIRAEAGFVSQQSRRQFSSSSP